MKIFNLYIKIKKQKSKIKNQKSKIKNQNQNQKAKIYINQYNIKNTPNIVCRAMGQYKVIIVKSNVGLTNIHIGKQRFPSGQRGQT